MHQEWGPKENERVHAWFYTEWHTATVRRVFHKADGPHPGLHAEVLWDSEYSTSELPTWWLVAEKRASMALPPSEPTPSNVETEAPRPQSDHPATGGPVLLAPSGKPFAPPPGLEGMNQTWNLLESPKDSDQGGHMEPDVSSTQAAPIELKKPQTCSSRAPPKGHVANVPPVPPPSVPPTIEVARPLRKRAEGPSDPELRAFVKNWSLSESSRKFLKGLPGFVQQEVVNNFRPGTTVGIDPILHTFARRIWDAKCDAVDLESFVENWGLDQQTAEYLDSLPLDLQKQVVRGFHPPSEEKRPMDIQIRRFAHSIADKLHIPLPRERSNSGTSSMATTKATETGGSTPAERDGADGTPAAAPARAPAPTQPRTEPKVWNQQEDALVRDLKNEILELRKQLEQAKEKHDDEALKEIADHLEASHAIVAAQTRDWVDFEEENAELSKKRARSFIRSSSHEMFPYLANHSEDPHLCFKLVMHVPEGKEQSLGADISSDFRLPPALGVCETTGYIRNQGGCLTLRPAAAPSGRSGRFASIEVNGNKLSREQKLHHLDCVLFGRSTSFYVFLQHASAEEVDERLRASRADMEDWDGRITQPLVDKILGEARSKDPAEVKLAREYCDLLRGQNRDSEGELMLRAFMCQARRARVKVDEANELTRCVRPSSGLHFELAAQAPVLSYGFYRCANLPELCVRLVRRTRFRAAVRKVMAQLKKQNLIQAAVRSFLPAKSESFSSDYQLLSTWTLPKFYARLEMMYEVRQNQLDDPSIKLEKLDKWKDPWAECGVAEVEALQEEHRLQIEDLRDRNRKRETEIQEAAQQQLQRLQEELKAANAELLRRNDKPREVEAEGRPTPPGFNGAQAPGLVARCLELGKANKALLESLCVEQREGFEP